jgi:hypothetical protein
VPHMLWRFIKSKVYSYSTKFVDWFFFYFYW